ncbi:MAG: hypothetical protein HRU28_01365 [Rhizobiales bacterium]|nr:hypothetical protein [Hyphomicrobiales bacterium]
MNIYKATLLILFLGGGLWLFLSSSNYAEKNIQEQPIAIVIDEEKIIKEAKEAILSKFSKPEARKTAKFEEVYYYENGTVCGYVSSLNKYGFYPEQTLFIYITQTQELEYIKKSNATFARYYHRCK